MRILHRHRVFKIIVLLFIDILIARGEFGPGRITGTVIDSQTEQPIELVNVIVYDNMHKQITGTATDQKGNFFISGINIGEYIVEFSFVGFETEVKKVNITVQQPYVNLNYIKLIQKPILVEGLEVTAEKLPVEFKIDKKIINVKEHYASQSGTAVDILQNIPSINVDIQGNVTLRGSSNFRVLVDNIPSILEPSDALQQIPASTIDRIEIITNPSARYDPEGLAGIINIITRKDKQSGINGIASLSLGIEKKYSGDFLLNYRHKKLRTFLGLDYNNFHFPGKELETRQTFTPETTYYSLSAGNSLWLRRFYGLKIGSEYMLDPKSRIGVNLELRRRGMERSSFEEFTRWSDPGDTTIFFQDDHSERSGIMYTLNSDYINNFKKDQKLTVRLSLNINNGEDKSSNTLSTEDSVIKSGWRSVESGPMMRLLFNLDYTSPLNFGSEKNGKLETGTQSTVQLAGGGQDVYTYDTLNRQYIYRPEYSHRADFIHNIHAIYTTHRGEIKNFGYQAGLRGEYTYRFIQLTGTTEDVNIRRIDFFPTLHISYKFPPTDQIMVSFTRRVNRPRDFDLEPFEIQRSPYSIFKGNPALLPEFVNAFELGYQRQWGNFLFSLDGYYRLTHNKIEHTTRVYNGETLFYTVENVGRDYAYGFEPTVDLKLARWLNINFSANLYEHRIEGVIADSPFSSQGRTYSLRAMNTLIISRGTRLQISGIFNSSDIMAQGEREKFFVVNGGLRQEIIPKSLNLTLQVRDVLSTGRFEHTSRGENFYIHEEHERKSPVIILTLNYNFNNHKAEPQRTEQREEEFEEMEDY
ncbi:MAG: TonB-dependent receptor [candidate division WOR-3 bacterium]